MRFWQKINAGALQLTLFIGILVALILTAFILLVHTHNKFRIQTSFIVETIKNAKQGINYSLLNETKINDTTQIEIEGEEYKSLNIYRDFWGVFGRVSSVSKIKNNLQKKCALVGGQIDKSDRPALYVKENQKPLVVVGKTEIIGDAYLPQQGVKSGTIAGNSYYGSQLIYGKTKTGFNFPKIDKELVNYLSGLENNQANFLEEQFLELQSNQSYQNSFFEESKIIYSNQDLLLSEVKLTGNIIIQSQTKIVIDAFGILSDVVLIAPEIEIKDNVKGRFQAIACEQITVGKNVHLEFPSALVVQEKPTNPQLLLDNTNETIDNSITIDSGSKVSGLVIFNGRDRQNNYEVQISIKEDALVTGEVFCNQNIELIGSVIGSLYTNNFIANQAGSIYQNHIYNGTINSEQLPDEYVGLDLSNSTKKEVVKWLY